MKVPSPEPQYPMKQTSEQIKATHNQLELFYDQSMSSCMTSLSQLTIRAKQGNPQPT
jgi:hypothetical protein